MIVFPSFSLLRWLNEREEAPRIDLPPPPKPKLVVVNHAPSRDEFRAWRDDPTTQFVFAALRTAQAEQKAAWDDYAWAGKPEPDDLSPNLLILRTRADAYAAIEEADYEALCQWAGCEPESKA